MSRSEAWKPVVGYEGIYEVSDCGRVRSSRSTTNTYVGKILRGMLQRIGYVQISLCRAGKVEQLYIHRLVAAAFIGRCPEGKEVNHKDGVKTNNHIENLEYVTPVENGQHASEHGLKARGARHGLSRLTEKDVRKIRFLLKTETQDSIAMLFDVRQTTISRISLGHTWGWLT